MKVIVVKGPQFEETERKVYKFLAEIIAKSVLDKNSDYSQKGGSDKTNNR
jgi:hypothetical protein